VDHPLVRGLDRRIAAARTEVASAQGRIATLPPLERDEVRFTRELKTSTDIYTALNDAAQKLNLIAMGREGNVRLVDAPMAPERPIKPNRVVIVLLGMIVGLFLGAVLAFARRALNGAIDDPGSIEQLLGARVVHASIPYSKAELRLARKARGAGRARPLLAQAAPEDIAVESMRSLRAVLLSAMPRFRNNIVMVAGPARGTGASFVSANLAAVLAAGGKRVLLIDADLRHGALQRHFGLSRAPGLADAVAGAGTAIHGVLPNLDFVAAGAAWPDRAANVSSRQSAFLLSAGFGAWLDAVRPGYDVVLLDPPPVLCAAETLILGAHAGAVFLLARAGLTSASAIKEALKRLNHAGILPQGVLFNGQPPQLSDVRSAQGSEHGPQAGHAR